MRRSLTLLVLFAVAALVAACASSSSAPGWTYAAPTSPPPSQPAASGSAAPSGEAPSGEAPSGGGAGVGAVQISALNTQFEQTEVSAPAGQAFVIHFENKDAGNVHNVEIKDAGGAVVFKGDLVTGVASADYQVPALAAGSYPFVCTVHANMQGTIKAG
jgi:plastocyanin